MARDSDASEARHIWQGSPSIRGVAGDRQPEPFVARGERPARSTQPALPYVGQSRHSVLRLPFGHTDGQKTCSEWENDPLVEDEFEHPTMVKSARQVRQEVSGRCHPPTPQTLPVIINISGPGDREVLPKTVDRRYPLPPTESGLPPAEGKKDDPRWPAFARRYGFDVDRPVRWEVEALEPEELHRLVLDAVDPYVDRAVLAAVIADDRRQRRVSAAFLDRWSPPPRPERGNRGGSSRGDVPGRPAGALDRRGRGAGRSLRNCAQP